MVHCDHKSLPTREKGEMKKKKKKKEKCKNTVQKEALFFTFFLKTLILFSQDTEKIIIKLGDLTAVFVFEHGRNKLHKGTS